LDKIKLHIDSKHGWLVNLFSPLFTATIKRKIEAGIEQGIGKMLFKIENTLNSALDSVLPQTSFSSIIANKLIAVTTIRNNQPEQPEQPYK